MAPPRESKVVLTFGTLHGNPEVVLIFGFVFILGPVLIFGAGVYHATCGLGGGHHENLELQSGPVAVDTMQVLPRSTGHRPYCGPGTMLRSSLCCPLITVQWHERLVPTLQRLHTGSQSRSHHLWSGHLSPEGMHNTSGLRSIQTGWQAGGKWRGIGEWGKWGANGRNVGEVGTLGQFKGKGWRRLVKTELLLSTTGKFVKILLVQPIPRRPGMVWVGKSNNNHTTQ